MAKEMTKEEMVEIIKVKALEAFDSVRLFFDLPEVERQEKLSIWLAIDALCSDLDIDYL